MYVFEKNIKEEYFLLRHNPCHLTSGNSKNYISQNYSYIFLRYLISVERPTSLSSSRTPALALRISKTLQLPSSTALRLSGSPAIQLPTSGSRLSASSALRLFRSPTLRSALQLLLRLSQLQDEQQGQGCQEDLHLLVTRGTQQTSEEVPT